MATLSDVARKAVVSKMTVSRVINHPEQVSAELRQLVYNSMKELNYVPNYAAQALVHNRTQVIKFLILEEMDTTEPYYMNLLAGIAIELDQRHYSLQLVTRSSHTIGRCDGLIVTGMRETDYDHIISHLEQPVILFGENKKGYDYVDVDNKKGMQMVTEHILNHGCQKILFYGIEIDEPFMRSRIEGYEETMKMKQLLPQINLMKNSSHIAQFEAEKVLQKNHERIAFVCASDRLGIGVVHAAQRLGLNIPGDVMVTGFDGVFLDRIAQPKLTTIRQPIVEMGKTCAKLLLDKIDQDGMKQGNRIYKPELIIRNTTTT
ncbi:LacI family transcriptional regulator [Sporolactobacillus sp. CPB3-1]|uniref:LacI family transcriptional regulator n=1 Tax=Sporolactobacillus mangiferae TaxID=2940498 RepID=A0ABT0MDD5_9BACL|nr:LacI family DNA-binding transcriptional regulator [Sporolactobacillus mangiferae]MCL1632885.1 LacI family transcriptional regulator [Sporolactobacillus mangiferae]